MDKVIRLTPTTHNSSVVDNGLFFDVTEIPNTTSRLGGTALLKSVTSIIFTTAGHPEMDLIFFKKGGSSLGTLGAALGAGASTAIDNNELIGVVSMPTVPADGSADLDLVFVSSKLNIDLLLEAEENKQSIYVAGVVRAAYTSDSDTEVVLSFGLER
jgi:hypothetical protein